MVARTEKVISRSYVSRATRKKQERKMRRGVSLKGLSPDIKELRRRLASEAGEGFQEK